MEYWYDGDTWLERPTLLDGWDFADASNIPLVAALERQLAQQQGVIEALQANIAELTNMPSIPPPVGSLAHLVVGCETKPTIPAQALNPAKLPKFF